MLELLAILQKQFGVRVDSPASNVLNVTEALQNDTERCEWQKLHGPKVIVGASSSSIHGPNNKLFPDRQCVMSYKFEHCGMQYTEGIDAPARWLQKCE